MGALVWSFLLRRVLSRLPRLASPCCHCQGTAGWDWDWPRCWLSPHLQASVGWWGCRGVLVWVLRVGWSHPAQRGEELAVPSRAAVRGCRCHFVLRVCCSCLPARLGGGCERPPRSPCLAEVQQNTSIVSRSLSAASQEQRIKCSSEEDN